ncbi:MAG: hypothetical protein WA705_01490 [Candidatus Ozemobacteraceae bacterium]
MISLAFSGCQDGNSIPSEERSPVSPGDPISKPMAKSVSFRVVLPGKDFSRLSINSDHLTGIRPQNGVATPTVTFTVTLVNIGNTANPTTSLVKTVQADSSGTARVTFLGIPKVTILAKAHIASGTSSGSRDFHGAADLISDKYLLVGQAEIWWFLGQCPETIRRDKSRKKLRPESERPEHQQHLERIHGGRYRHHPLSHES